MVRGWRNIMDPEDDGRVSRIEFFTRCRDNGFSGDVRKYAPACGRTDRVCIMLRYDVIVLHR